MFAPKAISVVKAAENAHRTTNERQSSVTILTFICTGLMVIGSSVVVFVLTVNFFTLCNNVAFIRDQIEKRLNDDTPKMEKPK